MSAMPTLLNICLEFVSDNLFSLISIIYVAGNSDLLTVDKSEYTDSKCLFEKYLFRNDIFLPENIAEKLITLLSQKGKLNDETIRLFERETTRLRRVDIPNASCITKNGLSTMKDHKLIELALFNLKLSMIDVIECLGQYNMENIQTFTFSKDPRTDVLQNYNI